MASSSASLGTWSLGAGHGHSRGHRVAPRALRSMGGAGSAVERKAPVRVPLNYYSVLGCRHAASMESLKKGYLASVESKPEDGYSEAAVKSRKELIELAYGVLSNPSSREQYDQRMIDRDGTSSDGSPLVEIPFAQLPGAMALLHEIGAKDVVLQTGRVSLQARGIPNQFKRDVLLSIALAYLDMGRDAVGAKQFASACEMLDDSIKALQDGGHGGLSIKKEIEQSLERLAPYCVLELLSLPLDLDHEASRAEGLEGLRDLIWRDAIISGSARSASSRNNPRDAGAAFSSEAERRKFMENAFQYMTAREQVDLFVSAPDNIPADNAEVYGAAMAHVAEGFVDLKVQLIQDADALLAQLESEENVMIERAMCTLMLGDVPEALAMLTRRVTLLGSTDPGAPNSPTASGPQLGSVMKEVGVDQQVLNYIEACSAGAPDLLPGIFTYTERWLDGQVLNQFREKRGTKVSLSDYFDDDGVQAELAKLLAKKNSTNGFMAVAKAVNGFLTKFRASPSAELPPQVVESELGMTEGWENVDNQFTSSPPPTDTMRTDSAAASATSTSGTVAGTSSLNGIEKYGIEGAAKRAAKERSEAGDDGDGKGEMTIAEALKRAAEEEESSKRGTAADVLTSGSPTESLKDRAGEGAAMLRESGAGRVVGESTRGVNRSKKNVLVRGVVVPVVLGAIMGATYTYMPSMIGRPAGGRSTGRATVRQSTKKQEGALKNIKKSNTAGSVVDETALNAETVKGALVESEDAVQVKVAGGEEDAAKGSSNAVADALAESEESKDLQARKQEREEGNKNVQGAVRGKAGKKSIAGKGGKASTGKKVGFFDSIVNLVPEDIRAAYGVGSEEKSKKSVRLASDKGEGKVIDVKANETKDPSTTGKLSDVEGSPKQLAEKAEKDAAEAAAKAQKAKEEAARKIAAQAPKVKNNKPEDGRYPLLSQDDAERIVREWQIVKAEALGNTHDIKSLDDVLSGQMLTMWKQRADDAAKHGWHWGYDLLSLKIELVDSPRTNDKKLAKPNAKATTDLIAVIEATIGEAATLYDKQQPNSNDSYKSTYKARYEVIKKAGSKVWKIKGGSVLAQDNVPGAAS